MNLSRLTYTWNEAYRRYGRGAHGMQTLCFYKVRMECRRCVFTFLQIDKCKEGQRSRQNVKRIYIYVHCMQQTILNVHSYFEAFRSACSLSGWGRDHVRGGDERRFQMICHERGSKSLPAPSGLSTSTVSRTATVPRMYCCCMKRQDPGDLNRIAEDMNP